jgi:hypothetical protein
MKGAEWLARSADGDTFSRYHAEAGSAVAHAFPPSFVWADNSQDSPRCTSPVNVSWRYEVQYVDRKRFARVLALSERGKPREQSTPPSSKEEQRKAAQRPISAIR